MSKLPPFLPQKLSLNGTWKQILSKLYKVFEKDFINHTPKHRSVPVDFTRKVLPDGDGKEEGFWHVVSRKDRNTGERNIDFKRAKRLPWAKPIIESPSRSEIKVFDYDHGNKDKGIRRYIWLENYDYVLILTKSSSKYFLITAFYVENWKKRDLNRRYQKRV